MDPISIAFGLAQAAPAVLRWITGNENAAKAAEAVIGVAKQVAGVEDSVQAASAVQADPALVLQFRQRIAEMSQELDLAFLADRADARKRDVAIVQAGQRNVRADVMVGIAFLAVLGISALLALGKISGDSAAGGFLLSVGGMFARNIGTAFDFEFGSSRGSQNKDELLARKAEGG